MESLRSGLNIQYFKLEIHSEWRFGNVGARQT